MSNVNYILFSLSMYIILAVLTLLLCLSVIFFSFLQGVPEQKLRGHLGSFGVTGNLALQPMYTLSGTLHFNINLFDHLEDSIDFLCRIFTWEHKRLYIILAGVKFLVHKVIILIGHTDEPVGVYFTLLLTVYKCRGFSSGALQVVRRAGLHLLR